MTNSPAAKACQPLTLNVNQNLRCEVPIVMTTACLGGDIEVPTLSGRVKLKVPPETQSGKVFRLRGKGVKSLHGTGYGDILCKVMIETPVKLTSEQQGLLKKLETSLQSGGNKHNPKSKGWFDGVKRFCERGGL